MHTLQVDNMSCNHCVRAVTESVQELDPKAKVEVDLANKKVTVESDVALDQISSAITEAGFPVLSAQ